MVRPCLKEISQTNKQKWGCLSHLSKLRMADKGELMALCGLLFDLRAETGRLVSVFQILDTIIGDSGNSFTQEVSLFPQNIVCDTQPIQPTQGPVGRQRHCSKSQETRKQGMGALQGLLSRYHQVSGENESKVRGAQKVSVSRGAYQILR